MKKVIAMAGIWFVTYWAAVLIGSAIANGIVLMFDLSWTLGYGPIDILLDILEPMAIGAWIVSAAKLSKDMFATGKREISVMTQI